MSTAVTYRRNVTKSRAGHSRLTLIHKVYGFKVTSDLGWNNAAEAIREDEPKLADQLAAQVAAFEARHAED